MTFAIQFPAYYTFNLFSNEIIYWYLIFNFQKHVFYQITGIGHLDITITTVILSQKDIYMVHHKMVYIIHNMVHIIKTFEN